MQKLFSAAWLAALAMAACSEAPSGPPAVPESSPATSPAPPAAAGPAAAGIPVAFHGEWTTDLAACGTQNSDSRLRIGSADLTFYESGGQVTGVILHSADEATVSASMSGEGETWSADYRFTLSDGGQTLTTAFDGAPVMVRKRCP